MASTFFLFLILTIKKTLINTKLKVKFKKKNRILFKNPTGAYINVLFVWAFFFPVIFVLKWLLLSLYLYTFIIFIAQGKNFKNGWALTPTVLIVKKQP